MKFKVFIPTAGIGERLGEITKYLNKSLVEVDNKPLISHIIEKFHSNQEFVIAVGYKSRLVKDYLKIAHPSANFQFVRVKNYIGKGSGLGLTMMLSKKFLQCPFIFFSCDSFILDKTIPKPDKNWMGYSDECNTELYRTVLHKNSYVKKILEKKSKLKNLKNYIGVSGIYDYKKFWEVMQLNKKTIKEGEVLGLKNILNSEEILSKNFSWYDCGNIESLGKLRDKFKNNGINILPKIDECIYFVNKKVIKFSNDNYFIKKRVERQKILNKFTPKIKDQKKNFYSYKFVEGQIFSEIKDKKKFIYLTKFLKKFWLIKRIKNRNLRQFYSSCLKFYKIKTIKRINLFYKKFSIKDKVCLINNKKTPKLTKIFEKIDWVELSKGIPGNFHGDLHFENILFKNKNKFIFLDWRQDFDGNKNYGDIYYDLAKLMHGMIISHNVIKKNDFKIILNKNKKKISYSFNQDYKNKIMLKDFEKWIKINGYNIKKVKILTSLIFLNIAPLHHYPYSIFLYYLGKDLLYKEIEA